MNEVYAEILSNVTEDHFEMLKGAFDCCFTVSPGKFAVELHSQMTKDLQNDDRVTPSAPIEPQLPISYNFLGLQIHLKDHRKSHSRGSHPNGSRSDEGHTTDRSASTTAKMDFEAADDGEGKALPLDRPISAIAYSRFSKRKQVGEFLRNVELS